MAFSITKPGKYSLIVETPVMPAAGTLGFGDEYRRLINLEKLGALVTNPVTYDPWSPASGARVVPMDAGALIHTGLPNPGVRRAIKDYRHQWGNISVPVIVHLAATTLSHVRKGAGYLDNEDTVNAIELGLPDDITWEDAERFVQVAVERIEKPLLVRLPVFEAWEIARAAVGAGADALVIAAPPRGTARDPRSGQLVSGRVYGPLVKPMVLRLLNSLRDQVSDVPLIGAGGIHSTGDARDYLDAGAVAVQVDSVTWVQPNLLERIARDLRGDLKTRQMDAFPDEWHPDMGDTEFRALFGDDDEDKNP